MNTKWKAFDSAPKDGTHILCYDTEKVWAVVWYCPCHKRWHRDNEPGKGAEENWVDMTHWMPLPGVPND